MLRLLAIIVLINSGICHNLSKVTWAHAVNSWKLLNQTLSSSDIQMIEADVIIGKHKNGYKIPIMGHPPFSSRDLSLEQFLTAVIEHNGNGDNNKKGIKLDYKTIEAVQQSVFMLKRKDLKANTLWINADIILGPGKGIKPKPVDANLFFDVIKSIEELKSVTFSIGWTTSVNIIPGLPLWTMKTRYSQNHVDAMIKAIEENHIDGSNYPISFPIRAAIAAESREVLQYLFNEVSKQSNVTFTIWSATNDEVNISKLQDLILSIGTDKVYVDVPKKLKDQLNLNNPSNDVCKIKFPEID
ncbi:protein FAM151B-like [Sitodiplosis mosellana]|uniref:protein FAM151B-like n=1 Tax=Sitodiplosis mosellana TaxID=263140 RepID=UPI00244421E1|nr:protein FAM151B-like [Sitodiplosis mosellana]XP_055307760.1 protein FAM151B-like [Sitodiplosis mosellana]XP_055307763.1 protein FAM151B-like [Sitodiplosis mosellana]